MAVTVKNVEEAMKHTAFKVKGVVLELDIDLAIELGEYLLSSECKNPALQALAWKLAGPEYGKRVPK